MGGRLVMVGSQDARTQALIGEDWDPLQVSVATKSETQPNTEYIWFWKMCRIPNNKYLNEH